jgi:hypothetical protein
MRLVFVNLNRDGFDWRVIVMAVIAIRSMHVWRGFGWLSDWRSGSWRVVIVAVIAVRSMHMWRWFGNCM